jgi:hypothetical protein
MKSPQLVLVLQEGTAMPQQCKAMGICASDAALTKSENQWNSGRKLLTEEKVVRPFGLNKAMPNTSIVVKVAAALLAMALLASCNRKGEEQTTVSENPAVAAARADEALLRNVISAGLAYEYNAVLIPAGKVRVVSPKSHGTNAITPDHDDYPNMVFREEAMGRFQQQMKAGLVTLVDKGYEYPYDTFIATPTALALKHRDGTHSTLRYCVILASSCQVRQIIKTAPYRSGRLPQSEEYRLVLGSYFRAEEEWFRALSPTTDKEFKFRAVLQFSPFTKKYTYLFGDWGELTENEWKTHNVE